MSRAGLIWLAVLLAAGFAAGWEVNGWRLGQQFAEFRAKQQQELIRAQDNLAQMASDHRAALARIDKRHTEELRDAEIESNQLRADIAAGSKRLSVLAANCAVVPADDATTAASLGHGEARAELDPQTAARIVSTAIDGDRAIRQLMALQAYVSEVCLRE